MDHQVSHALLLVCSNGDTCSLTPAHAAPSSFHLHPLCSSMFSLGVTKATLRIQAAWGGRKLEAVTGVTALRNLYLLTWAKQVMGEEGCSFSVTNSCPTVPFPLILPLSLFKTESENVRQAELVRACLDSVPPWSWSGLLDGTTELIHYLMWQSIMAVLGIAIPSTRFCVCIVK